MSLITASVPVIVCTLCKARDGEDRPANVVATFEIEYANASTFDAENFNLKFRTYSAFEFTEGASLDVVFAACKEHEELIVGGQVVEFVTGLVDIKEAIKAALENHVEVDDTPEDYEGADLPGEDDSEEEDEDDKEDETARPEVTPATGNDKIIPPRPSGVLNPPADEDDEEERELIQLGLVNLEWRIMYPENYQPGKDAPKPGTTERRACERWFISLPSEVKKELTNGKVVFPQKGRWPGKLLPTWRRSIAYAEFRGFVEKADA